MISRSRIFFDFRTTKLNDLSTQLIKKQMSFDHIGVDVGEFLSNALHTRDFKDLSPEKKLNELVRHVQNNVTNVFRKIAPKKSVALFFDGSEPLWKMRKMRRRASKKFEARHQRAAGQSLVFAVEDRLRQTTFERDIANEIVFSGCNTPGPVEAKMSSWVNDLSARPDLTLNDSICLLGSFDLRLSTLALVSMHNIYALKFDMGDYKCVSMPALLDWLDVTEYLETGDLPLLSKIRTDLSFLLLLCEGLSVTELGNITNINTREVLQHYHDTCINRKKWIFLEVSTLELDVEFLVNFLTHFCKKQVLPKNDANVEEYFEIALQSHFMICTGSIQNFAYCSRSAYNSNNPAATIKVENFVAHLKSLQIKRRSASTSENTLILSAAEYATGIAPTSFALNEALRIFNGSEISPDIENNVLNCDDTLLVAQRIRDLFQTSKTNHRALKLHPSHCWVKTIGARGPPPGYNYWPVNLGEWGSKNLIRSKRSEAVAPTGTLRIERSDMPMLYSFDRVSGTWTETDPYTSTIEKIGALKRIRLSTWNVQFDRHSGKDTPLGKPGIDWCSKTRYIALAKVIRDANIDVICMQETEVAWWEYLSQQSWVQENYNLSTGPKGESIRPWGVLMMIHKRVPTTSFVLSNVPGYTGHVSLIPCVTFHVTPNKTLQVMSMHLLAPYTKNNVDVRVTQSQNLIKRLERYSGQSIAIMGDFNDYPSNMMTLPPHLNLIDAWTSVHGTDSEAQAAGYTINGDLNTYCNLLIETEFFGRADRMYYRSDSLKVIKAQLIGTKCVREELAGTGIECPSYLYPSDHFGVLADFEILE